MSEIMLDANTVPAIGADGADALVIDTTTTGFADEVLEESTRRPVLVDFWAPWCGPCRTLSPIIESAVRDAGGKVKLAKMNIDEHPSIAGQLGIQSIPAVIAFVDGKPVDGFMGAIPEGEVKAFIEKLGGPAGDSSGVDDILAEAAASLAAGDIDQARQLYHAVLQADSDQITAIAGLARVALAEGKPADAREIIAGIPPVKASDADILAVSADIELAEQTAGLPDAADLEQRILADPTDYAARFDFALLLNARDDRAGAVDQLLSVIGSDREWNDGQAHKQLLQFFDSWGLKDPASAAGRRRLSALLFS